MPRKKLLFPTKISSTSFCYSGYGAKTVWAEDIVKSKEGLFTNINWVCVQCTVHCALQASAVWPWAETRRPCCKAPPPNPRGEEKSLDMAFSDVGHSWQLLQIIYMCYTCSSATCLTKERHHEEKNILLSGIAQFNFNPPPQFRECGLFFFLLKYILRVLQNQVPMMMMITMSSPN